MVLVDDEDYPVISRYSWRKVSQKHYAGTTIKTTNGVEHTVYMQQMILATSTGVDHENHNVLDNQKQNLRPATYQENGWNKGKPQATRYGTPASQYKGVVRCIARDGRVYWRVIFKITKKGVVPAKHVRLGPFDTEIEAAKAYNAEVVKVRGRFAWLNPIPTENENAEISAA